MKRRNFLGAMSALGLGTAVAVDKWITVDELRKQYKDKKAIPIDDSGYVTLTIINSKGLPSSAFSSVKIPKTKTEEYFKIMQREFHHEITLIKEVSFGSAKCKDVITHLRVDWDKMFYVNMKIPTEPMEIYTGSTVTFSDI